MTGMTKLDRIDISILVELQQNGRLSNVNLADAVGVVSQSLSAAGQTT